MSLFRGIFESVYHKNYKKLDIFYFVLLNSMVLFNFYELLFFFNKNYFNYKPKKLSSLIICFNCLYIIFCLFLHKLCYGTQVSEKELPVARIRNLVL